MCIKIYKVGLMVLLIFNITFPIYGEKIDIPYDQAVKNLSNIIILNKSTPVKGEERYVGTTADGLAVLEIIGDKQNIIKASLLVTTPSDTPNIVQRNANIATQFVINLFPEREKEASDWLAFAMDKLAHSNLEAEEKSFGNKRIEVRKMLPLGIGITVEHTLVGLIQPNLEVTGIFYEEKRQSYAIVNGKIVRVGDKIEEAEVIEITKNFVKFRYRNEFFVKNLGEGVSGKQEKITSTPMRTKDLPLELRKKIFYEACEAENRAIREAKAKYPFSGTLNKEESGNRSEMTMNLMKKYRKEVWDKYNISEDQGVEIGGEGIEKHWLMPAPESPW